MDRRRLPMGWSRPPSSKKVILSLCDFTGQWPRPYIEAQKEMNGELVDIYHVFLIDIKPRQKPDYLPDHLWIDENDHDNVTSITADVRDIEGWLDTMSSEWTPHAVLCALPCTDFASSGARWFKQKDESGVTDKSVDLLRACIRIAERSKTWWALENPVGRLPQWIGKPKMYFQPCDYGDAYTKKTALWGDFNTDLPKKPVKPIYYKTKDGKKRGSHHWYTMGGKSQKTKTLRSITPTGFSSSFFKANP